MCGRYGRRGDKQKVAEAFSVKGTLEENDFEETYDASPGSMQPVVRTGKDGRTLEKMRWGFKLPDRLLFNTRSEGVLNSKFWKDRVNQRCIVPASMYFEWPKQDSMPKQKVEITVPGAEYFGIAGVYGPWRNPKTNHWEQTFSAFTSEPNDFMRTIHSRQPIILEPRDYQEWLEPSERFPYRLLRIVPEDRLRVIGAGAKVLAAPAKPEETPSLLMANLFD